MESALIITPGARAGISHYEIKQAVKRHREGDWGFVDDNTKKFNDHAVQAGQSHYSLFYTEGGVPFMVLTEDACRITTVKLTKEI